MIIAKLYCKWCHEKATWSRLMDVWWCADCRSEDLFEPEAQAEVAR